MARQPRFASAWANFALASAIASADLTGGQAAAAVAEAAAADGVARARLGGDVRAAVRGLMWEPDYRPVRPG